MWLLVLRHQLGRLRPRAVASSASRTAAAHLGRLPAAPSVCVVAAARTRRNRGAMGCGQSSMGLRWRGGGDRSNHSGSDPGSEDDVDENAPMSHLDGMDPSGAYGNGSAAANASAAAAAAKLRQMAQNAPGPGPLLPRAEISSSQLDFFRMLDSKIDSGRDYDPENADERAQEETRVRDLLRTWQSAASSAAAAAATAAATAAAVARANATPTHALGMHAGATPSGSAAGSSSNSAASSPRPDMVHSNGAADLYGKRYTSREYVQWQQQQSTAHQYVQQYHQQYYQQYQYQQHYPQPYQHQYYQFLTTPSSPKAIPLLAHQSTNIGSPVLERTPKPGAVPSPAAGAAAAGSPQRQLHHHLANSIVQYKKCGGTRTELL